MSSNHGIILMEPSRILYVGEGEVLFLSQNHHYKIQMVLGNKTNNFAELLVLKILLCFVLENNCKNIHIFRDSMIVINWVNEIQMSRITNLGWIFEEVYKLMENFDTITCRYVYREKNSEPNKLSYEGLRME